MAGNWKVALGRHGMKAQFLTEGSWPTKEAARKVASALLEGRQGPWTSATVVFIGAPSARRVAARHVARLARSGSGPTDAEWAGIRSALLASDDALDEAAVFLADRFGSDFAKALLDFVVDCPDLPSEHNFADPAFAEGAFAGAWKNRTDPDGHPIGDQVDVTADAVAELRDRHSARRP